MIDWGDSQAFGIILLHVVVVVVAVNGGTSTRAESVLRNIAEGARRGSPADGAKHYRIARGEAMECAASIDVMKLRKILDVERHELGVRHIEAVVAMLTQMIGSLVRARLTPTCRSTSPLTWSARRRARDDRGTTARLRARGSSCSLGPVRCCLGHPREEAHALAVGHRRSPRLRARAPG